MMHGQPNIKICTLQDYKLCISFENCYMFRRRDAVIREYHIQRSEITQTDVWALILLCILDFLRVESRCQNM
jgi:hypothetical protein